MRNTSEDLKYLSQCMPATKNKFDMKAMAEYWITKAEQLREEKQVYKEHWIDLANKIIAEIDKDGWCRLSMTKEEALEMKKIFETLE